MQILACFILHWVLGHGKITESNNECLMLQTRTNERSNRKIEWNSSCLCIPRTITGQASVVCADIESIATLEELDTVRNKLADVIVKWNTEVYYKQHGGNPDIDRTGNCQQFIDEVLRALNIQLPNLPPPLSTLTVNTYIFGLLTCYWQQSNPRKKIIL